MIDLDNISKTENYDIPDNYFEEFAGRMMQNIRKERNRRKAIFASGAAAVAAIAIATAIFFNYRTPEQSPVMAEQQKEVLSEEQELEMVASEYYSEELALMDYYNSYDY